MGQGALHRRADGDARGQLPGMTVSSAAAEAMQKRLENPLPPKHPLSTMRQNRVLDLYIGNLIAGTVSSRSRSGSRVTRDGNRCPESPGISRKDSLAESPDGQFESYIRSSKVAAPEGEVSGRTRTDHAFIECRDAAVAALLPGCPVCGPKAWHLVTGASASRDRKAMHHSREGPVSRRRARRTARCSWCRSR